MQFDFELVLFCIVFYFSIPQVAAAIQDFTCACVFSYVAIRLNERLLRSLCSGISFPEDYFIDVVYVSVCASFLVFFFFFF